MIRKDVVELFRLWRNAGLRPLNADTPEAANSMIDAFLGQYANVTPAEAAELGQRLCRLQYWPRFYDVDSCLKDIRRAQALNESKPQKLGNMSRAGLILKLCGGRKPQNGQTWADVMATRYAAQHFPEAAENFVAANKLRLAAQLEADYICRSCEGKTLRECSTGGHRPFLAVDKHTGECVEYVDCQRCEKILVPLSPRQDDRKGMKNQ